MKRILKWCRTHYRILFAATVLLVVAGVSGWAATTYTISRTEVRLQEKLDEQAEVYKTMIEETRDALIRGLYTADATIAKSALSRDDRILIYMREAKGLMLEYRADRRMSDEVIDEMLMRNFELSERHGIHPALFLAFAQVESGFHPRAVSVANARGIVQFMPATAEWVLGEEYENYIEFNPVKAVDIWYRYITPFINYFGGDIEWVAAAYLSPHALRWYAEGKTVDEYLEWVSSWSSNPVTYSSRVKTAYSDLKDRIYHRYIDEGWWAAKSNSTN